MHTVAAGAEPSCDEGVEMGVDAFFDVVQFVRWDHLVAADAQARGRGLPRHEPALSDWSFHLLPEESNRSRVLNVSFFPSLRGVRFKYKQDIPQRPVAVRRLRGCPP